MAQVLHYGKSSAIVLEIPPAALLADNTLAREPFLEDPAAAMAAALQDPVGYPPLARAVVPGDHVVISVDPSVPQAECLVAGVVRILKEAGVTPGDIAVLCLCAAEYDMASARGLPDAATEVKVVAHDPRDPSGLCYLAATKDAAPIYMNRHLCEADVIVPISLLRPSPRWGVPACMAGCIRRFPMQRRGNGSACRR